MLDFKAAVALYLTHKGLIASKIYEIRARVVLHYGCRGVTSPTFPQPSITLNVFLLLYKPLF